MPLEENFNFICPYCSAENSMALDLTGGSRQRFVIDCETCCSPIVIRLRLSGDAIEELDIRREND